MKQERTTLLRKLSIYGFKLVEHSHNIIALLDFDVTDLRKYLRQERIKGEGGSLFAFILKAIGKCLEEYPEFNSMINLKHTSYFEEVDINIPIETNVDGKLNPKQYLIKNINKKSLKEVDEEIRLSKYANTDGQGYVFSKPLLKVLNILPKSIVLFLFSSLLKNHKTVKKLSGTVFVTSVSMFSNISGYIIPYIGGPKAVSFAVGSVSKKPIVKNNEIKICEIINITAIFNHDIIDGAPAARFINKLRRYVEDSYKEVLV